MRTLKELEELEALQRLTGLRNQELIDHWEARTRPHEVTMSHKPPFPGDPDYYARAFCNEIQAEINEYRVQMDRDLAQPVAWSKLTFAIWTPNGGVR